MPNWHLPQQCVWVYIMRYHEADTPLRSFQRFRVEAIDTNLDFDTISSVDKLFVKYSFFSLVYVGLLYIILFRSLTLHNKPRNSRELAVQVI